MANCYYCGEPTGGDNDYHNECLNLKLNGERWIESKIGAFVSNGRNVYELKQTIDMVDDMSRIKASERRPIIINGWKNAVFQALEDHVLSYQEELALNQIADVFQLSNYEMEQDGVKALISDAQFIRMIMEGDIQEFELDGAEQLFSLHWEEKLVWAFADVDYFIQQTYTRYQAGSQELHLDIAGASYLSTKEVSTRIVQDEETVHIDKGMLGITTKHIHFVGSYERFRIHHSDIKTMSPYLDGIGITQFASGGMLRAFMNRQVWFTFNLVANLAKRLNSW